MSKEDMVEYEVDKNGTVTVTVPLHLTKIGVNGERELKHKVVKALNEILYPDIKPEDIKIQGETVEIPKFDIDKEIEEAKK